VAATGRAWVLGPLGLQIEAGQSTYTSAVAPEQLKAMQLAPSVMYSPPNLVTYAIWARPYIGAGINLYRSTLRSTLGGPGVVDNSFGSQVLAGAEFTWASVPQFTVSADFRQRWAPPTFAGSSWAVAACRCRPTGMWSRRGRRLGGFNAAPLRIMLVGIRHRRRRIARRK
jgi:hypothetical protein